MHIFKILRYLSRSFFVKLLIVFLITSLMGLSIRYHYQRFVTFGLMPFLLFYLFAHNRNHLSFLNSSYLKNYILIIFLSVTLIFESIDIEIAFNNIIQMFGVLLGAIIILEVVVYKKEKLLSWVLFSYVVGFYISVFFLKNSLETDTDISSEWIDRSKYDLNANKYSYYSFIANIALFYLIEITKKKIYIILSFITLFLGVYVSFYTASRSGFIFTGFIGIVYWVFIFDRLKRSFKFVKFVLTVYLLFIVSKLVYETYTNSYIKARVERSSENGDSRTELAEKALNVFLDHPFTGVGPAQFSLYENSVGGSYSHNSYLEAASNLGLVGLCLVSLLFFLPMYKTLKKRYFKISSLRFLSMLYFFSFLIYNHFYVFYWSAPEMMFFFLSTHILEENRVKINIR